MLVLCFAVCMWGLSHLIRSVGFFFLQHPDIKKKVLSRDWGEEVGCRVVSCFEIIIISYIGWRFLHLFQFFCFFFLDACSYRDNNLGSTTTTSTNRQIQEEEIMKKETEIQEEDYYFPYLSSLSLTLSTYNFHLTFYKINIMKAKLIQRTVFSFCCACCCCLKWKLKWMKKSIFLEKENLWKKGTRRRRIFFPFFFFIIWRFSLLLL